MSYQYFDIDQDTNAREYVEQQNDNKLIMPTNMFTDGPFLVGSRDVELATKLRLKTTASRNFFDLIIIGSGPAGLTDAYYSAREEPSTLLIDQSMVGGQARTTQFSEHYPGFPGSIGTQSRANA